MINSFYMYMVKTFLKMLVTIYCSSLRTSLSSSATLLYKKQIILTTSMSVYIIQIAFFWEEFLTYVVTAGLFSWLILKFWSFIVSCCSLILLLPNIVSSEGLFRYGTSISRCLINISSTAFLSALLIPPA